jgi:hypothetical protein
MITQWTNNGSYSTVPNAAISIVANRVGMLDSYIMFCTAENEYTALINPIVGKPFKVVLSRDNSGNYNYVWRVSETETADTNYTLSNEYYCYSNIRVGQHYPIDYSGLLTAVVCICATYAFFARLIGTKFFRSR